METIEYGSLSIRMDWGNIKSGIEEMASSMGAESYEALSVEDRGVVSVGMIPKHAVDAAESTLRDIFGGAIKAKLNAVGIDEDDHSDLIPGNLFDGFGKAFTLGMLGRAREHGNLLV
jgi:hypothetical protein